MRRVDATIEHAMFKRGSDGSAFVLRDGRGGIYEEDPEAWRKALEQLRVAGFVELATAIAAGLVPSDWQP